MEDEKGCSTPAYQNIGDEHAMELALLQELGQLDPVLDAIEIPGTVSRMPPQPRRLMPAAGFDKGIYDELLLVAVCARSSVTAARLGG